MEVLVPEEKEITVYNTIAKQAMDSKFYKMYGDASALLSIMLSARELGIPPMSALNGGLNIIKGRVEISARLMNAMIRRAGHSLKTIESTSKLCKIEGKRKDNGDTDSVTFTIDDAKMAGLITSGSGWAKYPADMLYARALSRLARRLFADVIGCAYVEGEISESVASKAPEEVKEEKAEEVIDGKPLAEYLMSFEEKNGTDMMRYINLVHAKYDISYTVIFDKFHNDNESFMEKFNKWKESEANKA